MGESLSIGGVVLLLVTALGNLLIMQVNKANNQNKAEANALNFQSAYVELSQADRKRADEDRERLLRLEKQIDALLDDNKEKKAAIADYQAKLAEAYRQMAQDKATIERLSEQLKVLPELQTAIDKLTTRIAALEAQIETMKAQHKAEITAKDEIIEGLRVENTSLKARLDALNKPSEAALAQSVTAQHAGDASNG